MAEKSFGLKQINMIGVGTPAIESSDDLIIKTNSSERVRILSGGNIGIGTTNPTERLHLIGGSSSSAGTQVDIMRLVASDFSPTNSGGLTIGAVWHNTDVSRRIGYLQSSQNLNSGSTNRPLCLNPNGGNVGIGTDDPERTLSVAANNPMIQIWGTGGSGKQWSIISSDDTTGAAAASRGGNFVIYDDTSGGLGDVLTLTGVGGSMGLGVQNPGAKLHVSGGNIKVDDGFGIDFSATADGSGTTTSELLDDYEEGTWTPVIKSGTNTISVTGDNQAYTYTKVGRKVTVYFAMDGATTSGTTGGDFKIGGLPFAMSGPTGNRTMGTVLMFYGSGLRADDWPAWIHLNWGSSTLDIYEKSATANNYDRTTVGQVGASSYVFGQITYDAA